MRDTERDRCGRWSRPTWRADALHAPDYQLITPHGYAMSKDDYLGRIASGQLRYRIFEPASEIAVRGGDEVALLRYQALISVSEDDGVAPAITCWHTNCYEWRDASWQAVWTRATAIITVGRI